jgi:hypothetical protein
MTPSFAMKRGVRYRYYVSRAVTEGRNDLAGSIVRVPALDAEEAVLDALHKLASTVGTKRWSSLLGPRTHVAAKLIEFPAIAPRDLAAMPSPSALATTSSAPHITGPPGSPTSALSSTASQSPATAASSRMAFASSPAMALASESRRLIEAVVERVVIRDGSIEISLTREAATIVGEATVVAASRERPARVSRELIPPLEGVHPDALPARSDTKVKLLAGIARARTLLDELIAGKVLDIADLAQREKRSVRSTTMQLSLAFLAPGLVHAIVDNRLPRGIGLTRLADLPSDWSEQFKMLGLQAPG